MGSKNYDNWERLVDAVLLREELRRLALCHSREPSSISDESSRLSFSSSITTTSDDPKLAQDEQSLHLYAPGQELISIPASMNIVLDDKSGKKYYTLGARDLRLLVADASWYWKWRPHADSSFSDVAELYIIWRLDIRGRINTKILQPWNVYGAYLVFQKSERAVGLESAKAVIRFVDDESDREALKRAKTVHFQPLKESKGEIAVARGNGWMEVEMGNFYVGKEENGIVEARLASINGWKTGLIVEGILFRPTCTYTDAPLVSKKYMLTNALG